MEFARCELNKYAALMGFSADISLRVEAECFEPARFFRFDPRYDDAFSIAVKDGAGTICATNERALLIGVYHFFKCQGCRFLKPGPYGELIPRKNRPADVCQSWYAKTRHRGTTDMDGWGVEDGFDNLLDYIDWLPKMAMNTLFIELEDIYPTIRTRYATAMGPYKTPVAITKEAFDRGYDAILRALQQRHLVFHNVGHGWTIRMMEGITKISFEEDLTPCRNPEILAMTGGKRQIFRNKPLWTNLCYSQEQVRKGLAQRVYEYAVSHPHTDVIHFWLADYFGNFCECEECRKKRPSDWYLMILNEIDRVFTEHGNDTRIVFLVYFELAYPPLYERLNNPDRFIMMFAPYGRDFRKSYRDSVPTDYVPRLNNDFNFDCMDMDLYLRQLEQWQQVFQGDSFAFDYVFYCQEYFERICQVDYAKIPYLDCVDIRKYGLNGKIECGNGRALTPTSFLFHAMFAELFYGNTDFSALYQDYFESAYGAGQKVSAFLEKIAAYLPKELHRRDDPARAQQTEQLCKVRSEISRFRSEFDNYVPQERIQRFNCRLFREYLRVLAAFSELLYLRSCGASADALAMPLEAFEKLLYRTESMSTGHLCAGFTYVHLRQFICGGLESESP